MAKVNIVIDTVEKTMEVSVDGSVLPVMSVSAYKNDSDFYFDATMQEKIDDKTRKTTFITASKEKYFGANASKFSGLYEADKLYSTEDLAAFLMGRKTNE